MYSKFTLSDAEALRAIVGAERVLYGDEISADYSHDELGGISRMPDVRVSSANIRSASFRMRTARSVISSRFPTGVGTINSVPMPQK